MTGRQAPIPAEQLTIVPANQASWEDLDAIFGSSDPGRCRCQRFKVAGWIWHETTQDQRTAALRCQTACDDPDAATTSGLVAYLGGEPVGWCAVEPRIAYPRLRALRMPWAGRDEDKDDATVWAITCFVTRAGYRKRGVSYALARAAVDFARERGAAAVEGYAMITEPGREITWGELHVGALSVYEEAGLRPVSWPSKRRVIMRIDF